MRGPSGHAPRATVLSVDANPSPPFPGTAAVIRGPGGNLYFVASGMPTNITGFRITVYTNQALYPKLPRYNPIWAGGYFDNWYYFGVSGVSNYFEISTSALTNGVFLISQSQVKPYGNYGFTIHGIRSDGQYTLPISSQDFTDRKSVV